MPRFGNDDDMNTSNIGGTNFKFSAKKIEQLDASEYTLVTVAVDKSGSLHGYGDELDKLLGYVVEACRNPKNPHCDNMMLRVVLFDGNVQELHGFRPVRDLNPGDYNGACDPGGVTAAFDAIYSSVLAGNKYAKDLSDQHFTVNGALFVITDGIDICSSATPKMIKEALEAGVHDESIESTMTVLIGIGTGSTEDIANVSSELDKMHKEAGFQQYVYAGKCDPVTLAKVAEFIKQSASSQSQARGTGGPSQSLAI